MQKVMATTVETGVVICLAAYYLNYGSSFLVYLWHRVPETEITILCLFKPLHSRILSIYRPNFHFLFDFCFPFGSPSLGVISLNPSTLNSKPLNLYPKTLQPKP